MIDVRDEKVQAFARNGGAKARNVIELYAKNRMFINALSQPIGQELMGDVMETLNECVTRFKRIDLTKTDNEIVQELRHIRADFDAREKLVEKYIRKLDTAEKQLQKITKGK